MQKKEKILSFLILAAGIGLCIFLFLTKLGDPSPAEINYSIRCSASDMPIFSFQQSSVDYRIKPFLTVEVDEVWPHKPGKLRPVWTIVQKSFSSPERKLTSLTYGDCPSDYEVTHSPEPIQVGHFYRLNMSKVFTKIAPFRYEIPAQEQFDPWEKPSP